MRLQLSGVQTGNYAAAFRDLGAECREGYCAPPDLSCGALVLCGGGDLAPERYGQADRGSQPPDPALDEAELRLFDAFYAAGKPILGICRGMQVINVALGGDLIQDLPSQAAPFHGGGEEDRVHPVRAAAGTLLHARYGAVFSVNSSHHQAVGRLGGGLRAIAWAESGFPEALDLPGRPLLGVQFHPERMTGSFRRPDTVDGAPLLRAFLDLCT